MNSRRIHTSGEHQEAVGHSIGRALTLRSSPLNYEQLAELEQLLLDHIGNLLPEATARIGRLWRGSLEWDRARTVLDRIARQAQQDLGHGLLTDLSHVTQLARDCQWLLEWAQARDRPREHRD
ncbi:DUF6415 family natural product biosynthesis protein [Streptomyces syringium]|uniref:DUF6415 family natural product biosynthesis protein n=1 Tax=Streptomyces syringium TaxID=76729 RepID=UPI003AAC0F24